MSLRSSHAVPGLAPPEQVTLDPLWLTWALDGLESVYDGREAARIGLVRAVRPADVPAVLGWFPPVGARDSGSEAQDIIRLVAVLRSWEDRFGASLLQLGPSAVLRVAAERPPATIEAATALAAEHWAFCDGCDTVQGSAGVGGQVQDRLPCVETLGEQQVRTPLGNRVA